jgi:hypothetical protein
MQEGTPVYVQRFPYSNYPSYPCAHRAATAIAESLR